MTSHFEAIYIFRCLYRHEPSHSWFTRNALHLRPDCAKYGYKSLRTYSTQIVQSSGTARHIIIVTIWSNNRPVWRSPGTSGGEVIGLLYRQPFVCLDYVSMKRACYWIMFWISVSLTPFCSECLLVAILLPPQWNLWHDEVALYV